MKKVLIVSQFVDFPFEIGNDRFCDLAERLTALGIEVELLTSDFHHIEKKHRAAAPGRFDSLPYRVLEIHEPGYAGNVSLKRILSHKQFAKSAYETLARRGEKPDLVYCAVPSLDIGVQMARYAKENGIPFFVDVQDLWPEAFQMAFHPPVVTPLIYAPFKSQANKVYAAADVVVAVSQTYADRALRVNPRAKGLSVFLGTELKRFDQYRAGPAPEKPAEEFWIAYVGTLGHSYDLTCVIEALGRLKDPRFRLMAMGDGPLKAQFEEKAREEGIKATFTGRLPYPEMAAALCRCDLAVNPIMPGAAQSIVNKVGDYAAAGLPVVSTQECEEYRGLLEAYGCGLNCANHDPKGLAEGFLRLAGDAALRQSMGEASRRLAEERFDREKSYLPILDAIREKLL